VLARYRLQVEQLLLVTLAFNAAYYAATAKLKNGKS
jgi:hypothetical protein